MTTHTATIPLRELLALNILAGEDETRLAINGVHIEAKPGRILIVATDGRRLGALKSEGNTESTFTATIPRSALLFAQRLCLTRAQCVLSIETDRRVTLRLLDDELTGVGAVVIEAALIQVSFPKWRGAVPTGPLEACKEIWLRNDYVGSWARLAEVLDFNGPLLFLLQGELGPVEIVFPLHPEFRGILMPMRSEQFDAPERPDWMKP